MRVTLLIRNDLITSPDTLYNSMITTETYKIQPKGKNPKYVIVNELQLKTRIR